MRVVISDTVGGQVLRRLLPIAILVPMLAGWLCLEGERIALFDAGYGVALLTATSVVIFTVLIWVNASMLVRADERRNQAEAESHKSSEELDRFFNLSLDMLCIAGFDGYFERINPAWEATLGFTAEEMASRPFIEFIHPDDRETTNERYSIQIEQGKDIVEFENRYLCKNGSYRRLLWNAKTVTERELIYAVARDVTAAKLAEEALEQKAQELERSNAELEDFTNVVSHDLKEPLRGIEAFSGFLAEEYADRLDERGRNYLTVLQDSAVHMRDLIDDLLQLSRIGRTKPQYVAVAAASLVGEAVDAIQFSLKEKRVDLRIQEDLPTLVCDPVRIRQVFENLISNSIKYNDKPRPIIQIGCTEEPDAYRFSVRDNGPGIEPKYHAKVFRIFQRLVLREDHEGTGIGLTICKKIVEGHGGEICVESSGPGEGSTFVFSIPKSIEPSERAKERQNGQQTEASTHPSGGGQSARRRDHEEGTGEGPGEEPAHSGAGRSRGA
jgi:PAS domain S-box-containing protein